jgi:hypothetical protein
MGARNVHHPSFSAAFMPARVRSERPSLSNCANAARTPSISLPVEVSDGFSGGPQRDAKRLEMRAQREVIVLVACEARQVEHDHEMDAALFNRQNVRF